MKPVIVHGGGPSINRAMEEAQITPQWIKGRRVTDEPTLKIVEQVLAGEVTQFLTEEIERLGGRAVNLNFAGDSNVLFGEKLFLDDEQEGPLDLGFVGQINRVDRTVIENIAYANQVPVIPSMCIDEAGQKYNVNADTAAMAVAEALGAEKLVFLSDVNGVRRDKADANTIIHSLTAEEAKLLIKDRVIDAGMIPKIEACLSTLTRGVRKVHIIDGRLRHALEIYTTSGVGPESNARTRACRMLLSVWRRQRIRCLYLLTHKESHCTDVTSASSNFCSRISRRRLTAVHVAETGANAQRLI